jgi:hypothetical protein
MGNIAIVNSLVAKMATNQVLTMTAADEDNAGVAQKFVYTPTGKDSKICFVIYNGATEKLDVTISAGSGVFGLPAKTTQIPNVAGYYLIQLETGHYRQANGTVELSLDPNNVAKKLTTDHGVTVGCIELI